MLRREFWRITLQLDKIKIRIIVFSNIIFFCLLINNILATYKLCNFWYEVWKKARKYKRESELPAGNDMTV